MIAKLSEQSEDLVQLSVGGERFLSVPRSTLTAVEDSMLAAMFSGRHKLKTDDNGKVSLLNIISQSCAGLHGTRTPPPVLALSVVGNVPLLTPVFLLSNLDSPCHTCCFFAICASWGQT